MMPTGGNRHTIDIIQRYFVTVYPNVPAGFYAEETHVLVIIETWNSNHFNVDWGCRWFRGWCGRSWWIWWFPASALSWTDKIESVCQFLFLVGNGESAFTDCVQNPVHPVELRPIRRGVGMPLSPCSNPVNCVFVDGFPAYVVASESLRHTGDDYC